MTGSLSLDDVNRRFRMLEVRCGNCTRHGRLRIDKLIDEYGREMSLPDLRTILAGDCEHKMAARRKDQCQVFYPQLWDGVASSIDSSGLSPSEITGPTGPILVSPSET